MAKLKTVNIQKYPEKTIYQVANKAGDVIEWNEYATLGDARKAANRQLKSYGEEDFVRIYKVIHVEKVKEKR